MTRISERIREWDRARSDGWEKRRQRFSPGGPSPLLFSVVAGAIGGLVGASCMTVIRTFAQRAGFIEKTVPQVMEEWASERLDLEPPGGAPGHHVVDQLLHLGYGVIWGALYGTILGRQAPALLVSGVGFGVSLWAFGFFGLIPALRVHRPAHEATVAENGINIAAHLAYGLVVALLTDEITRQTERGPVP